LSLLAQRETAHPNIWASFIVSGRGEALDGSPGSLDALKVRSHGCGCDMPGAVPGGGLAAIAALIGFCGAWNRRRAQRIESCLFRVKDGDNRGRCDSSVAPNAESRPLS